jgi:hypothetical protein
MPSAFRENRKPFAGYSDASAKIDWDQARQAQPLFASEDSGSNAETPSTSDNVQTPAVPPPHATPDQKDTVAAVQKKNKPVESGVTKAPITEAQKPASARLTRDESEKPKPQAAEPPPASPQDEPAELDSQKIAKNEQQFFQGVFEVIDNCLVFDTPQREAMVVTTLPSRTWVRVEKKDGNYLFISSLNDPAVRGYVALEDASFERIGN